MSIQGYTDYKTREFCKEVECVVQMRLNRQDVNSNEYNEIRKVCRRDCIHSAWEFHHWLMDKGYSIVRPEK